MLACQYFRDERLFAHETLVDSPGLTNQRGLQLSQAWSIHGIDIHSMAVSLDALYYKD